MFKHLHQLSARRLFFNGGCQSSHASKKSSHASKKSSHASRKSSHTSKKSSHASKKSSHTSKKSSHTSKKSSHTSKKSSHASKKSGCSSLSSFVNSECNNDFKHLNFFRSVPVTYLYTLAFSRTRPAPMVSSNIYVTT